MFRKNKSLRKDDFFFLPWFEGYKLINENHVHLDYSFLSDDTPWTAWHNVDAIVKGDITVEKDYRRDKTKRGRWMGYSELIQTIGKNQAHKIFEQLQSEL